MKGRTLVLIAAVQIQLGNAARCHAASHMWANLTTSSIIFVTRKIFSSADRARLRLGVMVCEKKRSGIPSSGVKKCYLGRGCRNRRSQNPGIAKKGEGGSDPCQDFWWICRSIPKTLFRHHSTQIMTIYPQKVSTYPPKLIITNN